MSNTKRHAAAGASAPAQRLQRTMAAARVSFTWLGVRKTLSREQREQAAESFGAEGGCLSAAKKLIDTRHPAFKAVSAIRNRAIACWRAVSLPYPEPGIRLIRQDSIQAFDQQLTDLRQQLAEAVEQLDASYTELQEAARQRLGRLFDLADYPASLSGAFAIDWGYPSITPPQYLLELNPQLYEQEQARITARFEEAVRLTEQAFTTEFGRLIGHLAERLSGGADGKPKVFKDSSVGNLQEFFSRFKSLSIHSNAQLDELIAQAQGIVSGVSGQDLRDSGSLRQQVQGQLAAVASTLDDLLVDRPRRKILRPTATEAA